MHASPRAELTRVSLLLLLVCVGAFVWETLARSGYEPVIGEVREVQHVFHGKSGDNKAFVVQFEIAGTKSRLHVRRGILDLFSPLADLERGDKVPVLASATPPYSAVLNTLNGRYPVSLSFATLSLVFAIVILVVYLRRRPSHEQ